MARISSCARMMARVPPTSRRWPGTATSQRSCDGESVTRADHAGDPLGRDADDHPTLFLYPPLKVGWLAPASLCDVAEDRAGGIKEISALHHRGAFDCDKVEWLGVIYDAERHAWVTR